MGGIRFECDDRLVYACVSLDDLRRAGAAADETEGLIDILNSVDGLEVALLFKEIDAGLTKVSVRTRGEINANEVAAVFGGGGHARAAGAEIRLPLAGAVTAFVDSARDFLTPPA